MSFKRKKNLLAEEIRKTYREKEGLAFHNSFLSIRDPREKIACATHYNEFNYLKVNTTETTYVICPDYLHNRLKLYEYYLSGNFNDGGTILEVEKKDIPKHYITNINEIPYYIREQAPEEVWKKLKWFLIENKRRNLTETRWCGTLKVV
ncbi:MAG: hypothetical protein Q7S82_01350 [bacterium]|nr:hypothetical protein [bacterium]